MFYLSGPAPDFPDSLLQFLVAERWLPTSPRRRRRFEGGHVRRGGQGAQVAVAHDQRGGGSGKGEERSGVTD